jgi:hypothetical protein
MIKILLTFALLVVAAWLVFNDHAIGGAALAFVVLVLILLDHRT